MPVDISRMQTASAIAPPRPGTVVTKQGFQPSGSVRNENIPSQSSVGEAMRFNADKRDLNAAAHTRVRPTTLSDQTLGDRFAPIQQQLTQRSTPDLSFYDKARGAQEQSFESQRIRQNQENGSAISRRLASLGQQNSGAGLGLLAKTQDDTNNQINEQKNAALANLDLQKSQAGLQAGMQADQQQKEMLYNIAQNGSQRDLQQAQLNLQVQAANGDAKAKADLASFEKIAKLREFDINDKNGQLQQQADDFNKKMAQRAADSQQTGQALGALGTAGGLALAFSDEKAKKNVSSDAGEVQKFLDSLESKEFEYLDPKKPGAAQGKRFGIMAQDLEKSSMGKSLVHNTPQGKMVDTVQGTTAIMSGLAQINRRLKSLEGKKV